jgi:hypothetical protein
MKSIVSNFIGFVVLVAKTDGKGIQGKLLESDSFGLTVMVEIESDHEVKEKAIIYIPHKNVDMISARENDNSKGLGRNA